MGFLELCRVASRLLSLFRAPAHARRHFRGLIHGLCSHTHALNASTPQGLALAAPVLPTLAPRLGSEPVGLLFQPSFASGSSIHSSKMGLIKPRSDLICSVPSSNSPRLPSPHTSDKTHTRLLLDDLASRPPASYPPHTRLSPSSFLPSPFTHPSQPHWPFCCSWTPAYMLRPQGLCSCCSLSVNPTSPGYQRGPRPPFLQVSALSPLLGKFPCPITHATIALPPSIVFYSSCIDHA